MVYAIVNPYAAQGRAGRTWPRVLRHLKARGMNVITRLTRRRLHARHLAHDAIACGAHLIISVGGEGTFNEILNGMFHRTESSHHSCELGVIPIGTGTDLARTLGIPRDYRKAVDIIHDGATRSIDVGKLVLETDSVHSERYFINAFDAGLGGMVVRISNALPKCLGGFLTFLVSSLVALLIFRRRMMKIFVDGVEIDSGCMTIVGALNGQFFGGGMHAAPTASMDDGVLDFLYVKDTNIFKFVTKVLAHVYTGKHLLYKNVHYVQGKELRVECDKTFLVDIDGEEEKAHAVSVSLIPRALKIKVPH